MLVNNIHNTWWCTHSYVTNTFQLFCPNLKRVQQLEGVQTHPFPHGDATAASQLYMAEVGDRLRLKSRMDLWLKSLIDGYRLVAYVLILWFQLNQLF